ncbi:MAG: ferrochelatase [Chloroflexi bacterium HGW-Chloroflexi-6]|nr:MAG: ferrochelatase [Chloroflexi bacterium HGW-Chloroflexi-6]
MIGVLLMAYGGPNNLDEVESYLLDVRGFRPTAPEIIQEVRERYREIGGRSPILEQTRAQAEALQAALGERFRVLVGMRHWHPYIKDTLTEMRAAGIEKIVGLVMAPQYSRMSIGAYYKKIDEAAAPLEIAPIERWHLLPGYLDALAGRVRVALERFPAEARAEVPVIFTAHSLPERIRELGDPYPDELRATVAALMTRLGNQPHSFAFQSAAISNEPWLGPDAGEIIARYAAEGKKQILLAPIGFVCEHVEVLYDVDIVFKKLAESLGVQLERIEMLNTAPQMIDGLAQLIQQTAREKNWL